MENQAVDQASKSCHCPLSPSNAMSGVRHMTFPPATTHPPHPHLQKKDNTAATILVKENKTKQNGFWAEPLFSAALICRVKSHICESGRRGLGLTYAQWAAAKTPGKGSSQASS